MMPRSRVSHPGLREFLARALAGHNETAGSSARVERLLIMARPADLDAGEITDKGYVNQRKVLTQRAGLWIADRNAVRVDRVDQVAQGVGQLGGS
jgi:hypothetical protein